MLHERARNRFVDAEAVKLSAKHHLSDDDAYEVVKSIVCHYESEERKQKKQLAEMNANSVKGVFN